MVACKASDPQWGSLNQWRDLKKSAEEASFGSMSQAVLELGHLGVLLPFAHDAHAIYETVPGRCKLHCRMQCKDVLIGVGWRRNGLDSDSTDLI